MTAGLRPDPRLEALFAAIDDRDTGRFLGFLSENPVFRFGSAPPVEGREPIRAVIDDFFASVAGIQHEVRFSTEANSWLICEGEVTYRRLDGNSVTVPFADFLKLVPGSGEELRVSDYRIYIDIAPLYAGTA